MEENGAQEKTARNFLYWLWLSVVIVALTAGISMLWWPKLRIAGGILLSVGGISLLRFFLRPLSADKLFASCVAGIILSPLFGVFPMSATTGLPGILLSVCRYALLIALFWFIFGVKREAGISWLTWLSSGLVLLSILYVFATYILRPYMRSGSWPHTIFSSALLRLVLPYLFLFYYVIYRAAQGYTASPYAKRLSAIILTTGLLFGLFVVVLANDFELNQKFASLFFRRAYSLQFQSIDSEADSSTIRECVSIIRRRLDPDAIGWVDLEILDNRTISIGIHKAWVKFSPDEFIRRICGCRGALEFRVLAQKEKFAWSDVNSSQGMSREVIDTYVDRLRSDGATSDSSEPYRWFLIRHGVAETIERNCVVESYDGYDHVLACNSEQMCMLQDGSWHVKKVERGTDSIGRSCIQIELSKEGGEKMARLTQQNLDRALAILVDDNVYAAPFITGQIHSNALLTGKFTMDEIDSLINILSYKLLPVPLKYVRKED